MSSASDLQLIRTFIANNAELAAKVGPVDRSDEWEVREVGDGNINFVYIVTWRERERTVSAPAGGLCIKKALSYVRCVGESWSLTQERLRIEANALREQHRHCPEHVPEVFYYDPQASIMAMQYLPPPFQIIRKGLIQGVIYPHLAGQIAHFLATTLFNTSLLKLNTAQFRQQVQQYHNQEMCKLTEDVIFTEPYMEHHNNRWTRPQLDSDVQQLRANAAARLAVSRLKAKFCQNAEALLHGDFHTGSIMATEQSMFVIDAEFAFVGPMAFDVGKIMANLLLAYFATDGLQRTFKDASDSRAAQQQWLLACVRDTWQLFSQEFKELWSKHAGKGDLYSQPFIDAAGSTDTERLSFLHLAQQQYLDKLYKDAVSFAGAFIIRRLLGIAHVAEMEAIADPDVKAACERTALSFGIQLLVTGGVEEFGSVDSLTTAAADLKQSLT